MKSILGTTTKRRQHRGISSLDNVKIFAAACILLFLLGNLAMLQSYHSLVAPSADGQELAGPADSEVFPHSNSRNGAAPQRSQRHSWSAGEFQESAIVDNRELFHKFASDFLPVDKSSLFGSRDNQYSILEGRARRLMEDVNPKDRVHKPSKTVFDSNDAHRNTLYYRGESSLSGVQQGIDENIFEKDMLNCEDVENIQDMRFIGSGWTKSVYQGVHGDRNVAVKTVDLDGHDVGKCLKEGGNMTVCYHRAARKIVKEIVVLQALANEHVVKVLGFCVPTKPFDGEVDSTVSMVTELGDPIDQIKLLQMSWEDRLRVSYDILKLISFLAQSPYGSVALNDFRRTQFVLVNGTLKLSDVDDAGFGEPQCVQDTDCSFTSNANVTSRLKCSEGICTDHNELHNIYKTGQQFTTFLLPHGAPKLLRPIIDKIVDHFENLSLKSRALLREIERVVNLYRSGAYLGDSLRDRPKPEYTAHPASDFPGQFDYRCRFSISGGACTLSVFDRQEAEEYCNMDEECQGFVWTRKKTWTGRTIIHLKNGKMTPSPNAETDLYLKPS